MKNAKLNKCTDEDVRLSELALSDEELDRELSKAAASALFSSSQCPAANEILHPETLSEAEVVLLERHLESCERCAALVLATSEPVAETARVIMLVAALESEAPNAASRRPTPGMVVEECPELIGAAPQRQATTHKRLRRRRRGLGIPNGRKYRSLVDKLAGAGAFAVVVSVTVLLAGTLSSAKLSSFLGGDRQLIAAADDAIDNRSVSANKPITVGPAGRHDTQLIQEELTTISKQLQILEAQKEADFGEVRLASKVRLPLDASSSQIASSRTEFGSDHKVSALSNQRGAVWATLLFDGSVALKNEGHSEQANAMALQAFEFQKALAKPSALRIEALQVLVPMFLELNKPESAEKLLSDALESKPTDLKQAIALLHLFESVYGPDQMNNPTKLAAVHDRLEVDESRQD